VDDALFCPAGLTGDLSPANTSKLYPVKNTKTRIANAEATRPVFFIVFSSSKNNPRKQSAAAGDQYDADCQLEGHKKNSDLHYTQENT
jgi:hypothetical protein